MKTILLVSIFCLFGSILSRKGSDNLHKKSDILQYRLMAGERNSQCKLVDNNGEEPIQENDISAFWGHDFIGVDLTEKFMKNHPASYTARIASGEVVNLSDLPDENLSKELQLQKSVGNSISDYHGTQVNSIILGAKPFGISNKAKLIKIDFFDEFSVDLSHIDATVQNVKNYNEFDLFQTSRIIGQPMYSEELVKKGKPIVITAGNYFPELDHKYRPSHAEDFIVVGQLSPLGGVTSFASSYSDVTILAPGRIYSYRRLESRLFNGTSAAQPVVSGCLANVISYLPGLSHIEAKELLKRTAIPTLNSKQSPRVNGAGTVNCYKLARVASKLSADWPSNRDNINVSSTYDFDDEVRELRDSVDIHALNSNSCNQKELLNILRRIFLLSPDNKEVTELIAGMYGRSEYPGNANLYNTTLGVNEEKATSLIDKYYDTYFGRDLVRLIGDFYPQLSRRILERSLSESVDADKARDKFELALYFSLKNKSVVGLKYPAIKKIESFFKSVDPRFLGKISKLYEMLGNEPKDILEYCKSEGIEEFYQGRERLLENCISNLYFVEKSQSLYFLTDLITEADQYLEKFLLDAIRWNSNAAEVYSKVLSSNSITAEKRSRLRARKEGIDLQLSDSSEKSPGRIILQDILFYQKIASERFGYYEFNKSEIEQGFEELKARYAASPDNDFYINEFLFELAKVFGKSIDAHIHPKLHYGVYSKSLGVTFRPILKDGNGEDIKFLAFKVGTQDFLNEEYPYISKINGVGLDNIMRTFSKLFPVQTRQSLADRFSHYALYANLMARLTGSSPDSFIVELKNESGETTQASLTIGKQHPRLIDPLRRNKSKILEGNIGYLRIGSMKLDDEELEEIHQRMINFKGTEGIIIDIRGNSGGRRAIINELLPYFMPDDEKFTVAARGLCRNHQSCDISSRYLYPIKSEHFTNEERSYLQRYQKNNPIRVEITPELYKEEAFHLVRNSRTTQYHYSKKVIVLMDHQNFSAADVFLGAFKNRENITLMGEVSSGGSAAGKTHSSPILGIEYRLARMLSLQPNGTTYDTNGIIPDILVEREKGFYRGTSDLTLDQAVSTLRFLK